MDDRPPQQIGKYQLLDKIGQGGFGDVYLAEDTVLGSRVALKLLAPAYMRDPTVVQRFQHEARAAARLRHPNIVRIYDLGQTEGVLYLAMDYLPGRSLADLLRDQGPLPLERAAGLLGQIASALDYAHGQGLVHRDVKPANVMVGEDDHATLTDFGLVKAADHTPFTVLHLTGAGGATTGGTMIGTPEYMAPEQADPALGPVSPATDQYALGVVAYQMISGRVPFQAGTPVATLRAHADLPPPPPSQWAEVPSEVAAVVLRALAKRPGDRWPSAGAFAQALAEAASHSQAAGSHEARLAALYGHAEGALADRQWALALGLCGQIMAQAPTYRQVGDLFEQANAGLARQRAWEGQQAELAALYDRAMAHMAAQEWDEAISLLAQIVVVSQEHTFRDAPQRLAEARAAKERAEAERQARIRAVRDESLAAASHLLEMVGEWQRLEPNNADVAVTGSAVADIIARWNPPAQPEAVEEARVKPQPPGEVQPEPIAAVPVEVHELEPTGQPADGQAKPWERLPFEPEMVYVPAGKFLMGNDSVISAYADEKPQHLLYLDSFWIGRYPVTKTEYEVFVSETGYLPPDDWVKGPHEARVQLPKEELDHPVVGISWHDAREYCKWLSQKTGRPYRLPTEAEWEKAARGSDGWSYPWGNELPTDKLSGHDRQVKWSTPVGAYSPATDSPYGCADMAGNVCEWTSSLYVPYPYDPEDGREDPDAEGQRVLRGGSWVSGDIKLRCAFRFLDFPIKQGPLHGFRCCLSATDAKKKARKRRNRT